jgi:hypothetical protein
MLDIAERTRTIVAEQLFVDPDEVLDGASFIEDLAPTRVSTFRRCSFQHFSPILDETVETIEFIR